MNVAGRLALIATLALAIGCGQRPSAPAGTASEVPATAPPATPPPPTAAPPTAPPAVLSRIAVLGASVSGGFAAPPIATTLRAGLPPSAEVLDQASVMFFRDPPGNGAAAVEAAIAHRATLTIAVDFLFWFAYLDADAATRQRGLEQGLALLDRLPGTLAVGDLPDMRGAHPRMLTPASVPPADQLDALNQRIRQWAAARPATLVVPLAAWTKPLLTGAAIELSPGETVTARDLMFLDGLHANALGTWYLLDQLDRLLERELAVPADALRPPRPGR